MYRAMIADIHAQSAYLIRAKYRWLRISYILLAGRVRWRRGRADPGGILTVVDPALRARVLDPAGAGDQGG